MQNLTNFLASTGALEGPRSVYPTGSWAEEPPWRKQVETWLPFLLVLFFLLVVLFLARAEFLNFKLFGKTVLVTQRVDFIFCST